MQKQKVYSEQDLIRPGLKVSIICLLIVVIGIAIGKVTYDMSFTSNNPSYETESNIGVGGHF